MNPECIQNVCAYECAERITRLFETYGIVLNSESFDELEGIIQEYMQELSDRLLLPGKPPPLSPDA